MEDQEREKVMLKKVEQDDKENDPFRVRLKFSLVDWVKMLLVGVTLMPIRVVLTFLPMVIAWAVVSVR